MKNSIRCFILPLLMIISFGLSAEGIPKDFDIQPELKWKFQTAGAIYSSPVIDNNTAVFGSNDSSLYAVDVSSGKLQWTFKTGGQIRAAVAINDNSIYLNSCDGKFYSLDKISGKVIWTFKTGGDHVYELYGYADYFRSTPVYSNGILYFGSGDGNIYALRASSGELVWKFQTDGVVHSAPVIYKDKLYAGSFDGYLYSLDAVTGKLIWKFKSVGQAYFPKGEFQGSPVASGGLIFIGGRDYNLYAIDAEEGYCHWNKRLPLGWALGLSTKDSILFAAASEDDLIMAFDGQSGKELWSSDMKFNMFAPCSFTESMLYFGTSLGRFYGMDALTGKLKWTYSTGGNKSNFNKYFLSEEKIDKNRFYGMVQSPEGYISALHSLGAIFSSPAINENVIIFTSTDGYAYCLERAK